MPRTSGQAVHIIGGGPAGLMAAEVLARAGVAVTVHERMPSPGRKFLLAGHGGLNITHSEQRAAFVARYGDSAHRIGPMLDVFSPEDMRAWCAGLGEQTFVGTSGRVFPQAFRATALFRAWLARLAELGVNIERRSTWRGWVDGGPGTELVIADAEGAERQVRADAVIFALGGASWPHLGADGTWVDLFAARGVSVSPLRAANVGVRVAWSQVFADRFAGVPVKNVALSVAGAPGGGADGEKRRGDAMLTTTGVEGGPVYALGAQIRAAIDAGACTLLVDLRPDLTVDQVLSRLGQRRAKDSASNWLRRSLGLDQAAVGLLREVGGGALPAEASVMASLVKAVPLRVADTMPIARAISSAGGIGWEELDDALMLRRMPGTFVAGEMIDWEAPTGGYLLQASFATGAVAARGVLEWLGRPAH